MTQEFVPYEQALALKELGFDAPCFGIWMERGNKHDVIYVAKQEDAWMAEQNDGILAPLYQQTFRWFREKYNLHHIDTLEMLIFEYDIPYEEAELACLKNLIDIVKEM